MSYMTFVFVFAAVFEPRDPIEMNTHVLAVWPLSLVFGLLEIRSRLTASSLLGTAK